jgi:hypothetical protein
MSIADSLHNRWISRGGRGGATARAGIGWQREDGVYIYMCVCVCVCVCVWIYVYGYPVCGVMYYNKRIEGVALDARSS